MTRIGAIVLAAGASERFGMANKLLVDVGGVPMLRRVAEEVLAAGVSEVVVVTGYERERYAAVLAGLCVGFVHNDAWAEGQGGSVACGVLALSPACEAAFVVPADMPGLGAQSLVRLMEAYRATAGEVVVVPVTPAGEQRNPVLWPRRWFGRLSILSGPQGGKRLLADISDRIDVAFDDAAVFADIDTVSDYADLLAGRRPR